MESNLSYDKYPFLKEVGIEKENLGCYVNGKWVGDGEAAYSYNPHDGKPIAKIMHGST